MKNLKDFEQMVWRVANEAERQGLDQTSNALEAVLTLLQGGSANCDDARVSHLSISSNQTIH